MTAHQWAKHLGNCGKCPYSKDCPFDLKPSALEMMICTDFVKDFGTDDEVEEKKDTVNISGQKFEIKPNDKFIKLINALN